MKKFIHKLGILTLIIGMSACSVYHQETVDAERAIDSHNRLKVETQDNLVFELKELRRENGQLVGITGKKSETAKLLIDRPQIKEGRNVKISFGENEIRAIYLKNKKMSNIVNVGVPIVGVAGLVGLTNKDFRPDVGY